MDRRTRPSLSAPSLPPIVAISACCLLAVALSVPARAASQLVDTGAFRLYLDGVAAGTEEFTIRRFGTGEAERTVATGKVAMLDGRILTTGLRMVGPGMSLLDYQARVTGADTAAVRFERAGNYLYMNIDEPNGERGREYRARPMTFVFEHGVAHHYFVLGMFITSDAPATLHMFAPLADPPEARAEIEMAAETLGIGDETVETTRVRLGTGDGAGAAWFDGSGDLVQVELPARGYRAVRIR